MNRARLEDMALLMDIVQKQVDKHTVPPTGGMGFNLNFWRRAANHPCDTSACAVGWACEVGLIPGLVFGNDNVPAYGNYWNWEAIGKAFGISVDMAHHLFSSSRYRMYHVTPAHVAARIRELLAQA